jgi:integrase
MATTKLTARQVETFNRPGGKIGDGGGLWLHCRREGDRSWLFRYTIDGKEQAVGLGSVRDVSLAEARELARGWRRCLIDGKNPLEVKRDTIRADKIERMKTLTFAEAVGQFLSTDKIVSFRNDKHRKQWRSTLESVFPQIGDLPLQQIDTALILSALLPIWRKTPETGSRLRGRIARVFDWASGIDLYQGPNPAAWDRLKDHLPAKPKGKHHAAMPYAELPAFMARLRERDSVSASALQFAILTAARTQEVIGARWSEIDLDAALWTVPATRMKVMRDHRVPLSDHAVEILRGMVRDSDHVFVNEGKPLSNMAMAEMLKGMDANGFTVHGFRSAFSDWARDQTAYPRDLVEQCLAHTISNKAEAAYRRMDALDKRRRLMDQWARFLDGKTGGATVHKIGAARSA